LPAAAREAVARRGLHRSGYDREKESAFTTTRIHREIEDDLSIHEVILRLALAGHLAGKKISFGSGGYLL
jgi:hypothetical protein